MRNKAQQKLPPFAKNLVDRQRFKNLPFLVVVCVGCDAWGRAKQWNQRGVNVGLVLPAGESPSEYVWPVSDCLCVIEWSTGPGVELVVELARVLLRAGAESVTIWPRWVDYSNPHIERPADQPPIKTYRLNRSREVAHVAA